MILQWYCLLLRVTHSLLKWLLQGAFITNYLKFKNVSYAGCRCLIMVYFFVKYSLSSFKFHRIPLHSSTHIHSHYLQQKNDRTWSLDRTPMFNIMKLSDGPVTVYSCQNLCSTKLSNVNTNSSCKLKSCCQFCIHLQV